MSTLADLIRALASGASAEATSVESGVSMNAGNIPGASGPDVNSSQGTNQVPSTIPVGEATLGVWYAEICQHSSRTLFTVDRGPLAGEYTIPVISSQCALHSAPNLYDREVVRDQSDSRALLRARATWEYVMRSSGQQKGWACLRGPRSFEDFIDLLQTMPGVNVTAGQGGFHVG